MIHFIPTQNVLTILVVALVVLNSSSRGGFSVASTNYFAVVSLPLKLIVSDYLCGTKDPLDDQRRFKAFCTYISIINLTIIYLYRQ